MAGEKFQLKALITGVDKLSPLMGGAKKNVAAFRKSLESSSLSKGFSLGDLAKGGAFAAPFIAGAKAAIEFESAMADVRKVVDFDSPAQFKQMGDDVIRMSTRLPMAAKDIAAIVAAGGQAGLARGELTRFAEDAVKMGVAFDSTAEESGEMMAKWRTSFRLTQDQVVGLADKINYLSNNGPASAKQIASIVTRIGPLGEVAGLASGQIAAMGATLAGMGVQEEVAATGMKNFMLTLTAGASATKQQQQVFKALRMDAKKVAVDMQKDAQGTIVRILTAISKVDKTKQASVLQTLFGRESIGAIAPMLNNLDLLKKNFANVGDETKYAGSMSKEYEARAATTANNIQLLQNRVVAAGEAIGSILLPPINGFIGAVGPMVDQIAALIRANPWLIKGILGAALAFGAIRVAMVGASVAMRVLNAVVGMSPLGLVVRGMALAAGFLLANWETVGPWFRELWTNISAWGDSAWKGIQDVWSTVSGFFDGLWTSLVSGAEGAWEGLKGAFLNATPLGLVMKNWEPLVDWFKGLWERVKGYIEPITGGLQWLKEKFGGIFGGGDKPAAAPAQSVASYEAARAGGGAAGMALGAAAQQPAKLDGDLRIRFEGAPPGMRVEQAQTNQSGLSVTPSVGYRTLAVGG
ncbi:phage tail tape measure protein [Achromobacter xylosoxidans]|uniref:phage tail tape measure protein n=1 Tax=Alcaligenes xylosoxydans xylosoxydans TaxID=85698 RepID=UPI00047BF615|nr:phage tail tape measure protein [Achromobacter xylosoxidans]MCH4576448.1 phage tail tape measure protein [Achromobacter xylosoxidans]